METAGSRKAAKMRGDKTLFEIESLASRHTSRFNRRHNLFGHLFSGRYKALLVGGSGHRYLKAVCDYVNFTSSQKGKRGPRKNGKWKRLQSYPDGRIFSCIAMKAKEKGSRLRIELGRHIVSDSKICGGQPTFKGTRIMVWIVLEELEDGMSWDEIVAEWNGSVNEEAISEAIAIAHLVVKHEPFKGFHVGARRKPARGPTAIAA
jgi:uncharacterized protein (DUF433 family)